MTSKLTRERLEKIAAGRVDARRCNDDEIAMAITLLAAMDSEPVAVVPEDVLEALQKVARIRLDMNDFDGDRRGIADCLCDAEEALIEVVNRRAAMLAAAPQEVK